MAMGRQDGKHHEIMESRTAEQWKYRELRAYFQVAFVSFLQIPFILSRFSRAISLASVQFASYAVILVRPVEHVCRKIPLEFSKIFVYEKYC